VLKEIQRIERPDRGRVLARIKDLEQDPRPAGCEKLSGHDGLWRVRAGNYRIVYQIIDTRLLVTVVRVGHRGEVYRSL